MKENNQENQNDTGTCNGCRNCGAGCTCGRLHGYGGHPVLRVVLTLVILLFVFIGGIKLGELKAEVGMGYQYRTMMGRSGNAYGARTMGLQNVMPIVVPAVPVTPTATTAPAAQ